MPREKALLATVLVVALVSSGCISSIGDYLSQQGTIVVEVGTSPPDDSPNLNRSDIDDFETLEVRIHRFSVRPTDGTPPVQVELDLVVDLVALDREGPQKLFEETMRSRNYDRWGAIVTVQKAIHRNGSEVHVDTPANNFFYIQHGQDRDAGRPVEVPTADTITYRWTLAVVLDTEDIPGGPDGEYFLMSRPWESGVR